MVLVPLAECREYATLKVPIAQLKLSTVDSPNEGCTCVRMYMHEYVMRGARRGARCAVRGARACLFEDACLRARSGMAWHQGRGRAEVTVGR